MALMHLGWSMAGPFFDCHQGFLPSNHEFRNDTRSFLKGKTVRKGPLKQNVGADTIQMLNDLKESENGVFDGYGVNNNLKHKSCLWELPYAKALILPHNIDLIHQERNITESIMSVCLDVINFTKDNVNVRKDLADLYDCPNMEVRPNARWNLRRTKDLYYLKPTERKEVLRCLKTLKFPDRYAANIKQAINVSTGKLNGLKSHNYHIFIERRVPVMFCGYFKPNFWKMFSKLSYFYRQICAKHVSKVMMQRLEKEIAMLACKMETVFPLGWFNAMQHLLVHFPWEARVGGLV
jgi:hypothetical protein